MARNYPRFLLSKVTAGKSPGIYITHLLFPISLYKLEWKDGGGYLLNRIEDWGEEAKASDFDKVYKGMVDFVGSNIVSGRISGK